VATDLGNAGWLVAFALDREAAPFRRRCPAISTAVTGVGAPQIERLLVDVRPTGVIAAGFAGALRPGLRVGDVIVAESVIEAASAQSYSPAQLFVDAIPDAVMGQLVSVESVVARPGEKRNLGDRWSADAVDMESAAIARACARARIPFACVRVISDDCDASLTPALANCLTGGRVKTAAVLRCVARDPSTVWELWRLARHSKRAALQLARALDSALQWRSAKDQHVAY